MSAKVPRRSLGASVSASKKAWRSRKRVKASKSSETVMDEAMRIYADAMKRLANK